MHLFLPSSLCTTNPPPFLLLCVNLNRSFTFSSDKMLVISLLWYHADPKTGRSSNQSMLATPALQWILIRESNFRVFTSIPAFKNTYTINWLSSSTQDVGMMDTMSASCTVWFIAMYYCLGSFLYMSSTLLVYPTVLMIRKDHPKPPPLNYHLSIAAISKTVPVCWSGGLSVVPFSVGSVDELMLDPSVSVCFLFLLGQLHEIWSISL